MSTNMHKKLVRGGAWVLLGQAGTAISQVVIAILLARALTPHDYGVFQVIQRIATFCAVISSFGMSWAIVRVVAEALSRGDHLLAVRQVKIILGVVVLFAIFICLVYLVIGAAIGRSYLHLDLSGEEYIVIILIFLTALQQVLPEGFRGMYNFRLASLFGGPAVNIVFLAEIVILLLFREGGLKSILWACVAATGFVVITSWFYLQRSLADLPMAGEGDKRKFLVIAGEHIRAGISFTATNLLNFTLNQADVWIVASLYSASEAAFYAAASRLAFLMSAPAMLANGILRPTMVALWSAGEKSKLQSILRTTSTGSVLLTIIPLVLLAVYGGDIMAIAFGEGYRSGGEILFIISLGWFSLLLVGPAGTLMMLTGKQTQYLCCTLVSGLAFVIAALLLPKYFSVAGVAIAVALGLLLNSALASIYVWRYMGIKTYCCAFRTK